MMPSGCPVTPGFPIRRSPDQSSFDSSPRHIAAYHVLHRLSTPRHPPCTLNSLTTLMRGCHRNAKPMPRHPTTYTYASQATYRRKSSSARFAQPGALTGLRPINRLEPMVVYTHTPCPAGIIVGRRKRHLTSFRLNSASASSVAKKPGKDLPEGGSTPTLRASHASYRPSQCCQGSRLAFF